MTNAKYPPKVINWLRQIEQGKVKGNTIRILNFIYSQKERGTTVYEMRICLGMAHQTLTGCLSAIMDEGMVKIIGEEWIDNNAYSRLAIELNPSEVLRLKREREKKKFQEWLERGLKEFPDYIDITLTFQLRNALSETRLK
jgi:predicted transcriptional regulator